MLDCPSRRSLEGIVFLSFDWMPAESDSNALRTRIYYPACLGPHRKTLREANVQCCAIIQQLRSGGMSTQISAVAIVKISGCVQVCMPFGEQCYLPYLESDGSSSCSILKKNGASKRCHCRALRLTGSRISVTADRTMPRLFRNDAHTT